LGTHAYLEGAGSFLLRGDSSNRYTVNDLLEHQLKADLVVIAACETGMGEPIIGEGVASLGRGFARRGAPGLIMSLWSIDDATTSDLLNLTYSELAGGAGPATALQTSTTAYLQKITNPRFAHPYFWAGLIHYGPDKPLTFIQKSDWPAWLMVGIPLLLGGLFFYFRANRRSTRQ